MLIEFRCSNHKSIREEILFSMLAGSDTTHDDHVFHGGGLRLLRTAVIYGANGSGKSNLLDAIEQLRAWVLGQEPLGRSPHKLAPNEPSHYALQFLDGDLRYHFSCSLYPDNSVREILCCYPNGRRVLIYSRHGETVTVGDRFRGKFPRDLIPSPDTLFAADGPATEPILALRRFFGETLVPYHILSTGERMTEALTILRDHPHTKAAVLSLLAALGTGIRDIRVTGQDEPLSAEIVYPRFSTDLLTEESSGVRRMVEFLCPLVDMLCTDRILLCDEPETNLHELLLRRLIRGMQQIMPTARAQLIFSSHSTGLLDLSLFRRDQIWFAELHPEDRSTELFSLLEVRDIRTDENIRQSYIMGKYGAIPLCGEGGSADA